MEEDPVEMVVAEVEKIKSVLGPVLGFLQEVKDIKKGLRISAESSVSTLNLISLMIKGEVLKDVNCLITVTEDKIKLVADEAKENYRSLSDKLDSNKKQMENLSFDLKNIEDLIVRQNNFMDLFRKDIDYCKKELNDKVGYKEYIILQKSLKKYTTLEEFENVKERITELAEKTQIDLLAASMKKLALKVNECLSKKEASEKFLSLEKEIFGKLEKNFTKKEIFEDEIKLIEKRMEKIEEELRAVIKKFDMINDGFKRKIAELFGIINSKPWDSEIKRLVPQIEDSVTKAELAKFSEENFKKFQNIERLQVDQQKRSETFALVIERYDEILLDKASKDDISQLLKKIQKCLLISTFSDFEESSEQRFSNMSSQITQLSQSSEALRNIVSTLCLKIDTFKRENSDISNISTTLSTINETLERKADKSDIFLIYDVMGKKEEISKLSEMGELYRKQVLIFVGITQALCRTLLNNGENISYIKKQRFDMYKNLENLQKWIKEGNGQPSSLLLIGRSNVNLKTEMNEDVSHGYFGTAKTSRRIRLGSQGTSPRYFREDLPSLNLNM